MTHSKVFKIVDHTVPGQHIREYACATAESQEDPLVIAVKQYVPLDNPNPQPGDVTIIGAHANGFPKEMYEALWEDLHAESKKAGFRIRAIWIADVTQQGQSGIINEFKLGNDPSWIDHARDLLHLINVKRADMPRPLIGIGHSFGGNVLTNLALMHPRLLHSLVLLDPVISHFASTPGGVQASPAASSINRRDLWPSRAAAEASFKKSKFFGSWDPRVLSAWCEFGVRECPTLVYPDHPEEQAGEKPVTLTTSKHQELFTFFRPTWDAFDAEGRKLLRPDLIPDNPHVNSPDLLFPVYRPEGPNTVVRLPHLRPSVLYIFGETSDVSPPVLCEEKMRTTGTGVGGSGGQAKGRVKSVTLKGIGHLVAMEAPGDCSRYAAEFLGKEVERWKVEEREWEEWRKKDIREKGLLSKTWYEEMGQGKGPGKPQDKPAKL